MSCDACEKDIKRQSRIDLAKEMSDMIEIEVSNLKLQRSNSANNNSLAANINRDGMLFALRWVQRELGKLVDINDGAHKPTSEELEDIFRPEE